MLNVFVLYAKNPLAAGFLYHLGATDKKKMPLFYIHGFPEFICQILNWHPWLLIFFLIWAHMKSTSYWLKQMKLSKKHNSGSHPIWICCWKIIHCRVNHHRYGANERLKRRPKEVSQIIPAAPSSQPAIQRLLCTTWNASIYFPEYRVPFNRLVHLAQTP